MRSARRQINGDCGYIEQCIFQTIQKKNEQMTKQYFGTDGIRGKVGSGAINPEFILKLSAIVIALIPPVAKLAEVATPLSEPDSPLAATVPLFKSFEALLVTLICTFLVSLAIIFYC